MKILLIFLFGIGILIGAIILNIIASKLNLTSWFDFIKNPKGTGFISYVWLFIIYPFGLGLIAFLLNKFINI
jgi:hypothetical protein